MEQGPYERRILETCLREGLPIPKRMQNAPDLQPGLEVFMMAFTDLHTGRNITGEGLELPLPWDLIDRWCRSHDIVGETRDDVFAHVRHLDNCYLNWKESKRPRGKGK